MVERRVDPVGNSNAARSRQNGLPESSVVYYPRGDLFLVVDALDQPDLFAFGEAGQRRLDRTHAFDFALVGSWSSDADAFGDLSGIRLEHVSESALVLDDL